MKKMGYVHLLQKMVWCLYRVIKKIDVYVLVLKLYADLYVSLITCF